jgi:hypothetical protein
MSISFCSERGAPYDARPGGGTAATTAFPDTMSSHIRQHPPRDRAACNPDSAFGRECEIHAGNGHFLKIVSVMVRHLQESASGASPVPPRGRARVSDRRKEA